MFVEKIYIKCNNWRVAARPSYIWDARFLKVNAYPERSDMCMIDRVDCDSFNCGNSLESKCAVAQVAQGEVLLGRKREGYGTY
jgi:hypothetical protein